MRCHLPPQRITHERRATRGDRRSALPCCPNRAAYKGAAVPGPSRARRRRTNHSRAGAGKDRDKSSGVTTSSGALPCPSSPRPSHRQPEHQPNAPQSWCRWVAPGHRQASRSRSVASPAAAQGIGARGCAARRHHVDMRSQATAREHPIRLFSAASAGIGSWALRMDTRATPPTRTGRAMPRVAWRGGDLFDFDLAVVDAQRDRGHAHASLAAGPLEP